ncbi:uncharacterized protein LOC114546079 isoform X1 [Perca flavescens]|uniref:uncharacterized protein LOC114546079 isoform X1 n=1 Tax=Perca flavescens TaxID=8167 RepID=UPI00106E4846|nr:uncharacterized protein LOC114546079 isoform X1 [Perca flavescens]
MEVTTFCVALLMNALMLLVAHIQHGYPQTPVSDSAFRIVPTRLQLFEYESVHFTCEGFNFSAGCRVRTIKEFIPKCSNDTVTSTVTCTIDFVFPSDSGEYWCEAGGGKRSNTVNVTVTAGSVILESPALPVMEGDNVTLSCRTKLTSFSSLITNFYKDGRLIGSSPTGNLTIESVFMSHDGRYKCNIPGAGESPESWLAVREENGSVTQSEDSNTQRADRTAKTASTISQSPNEEPISDDSDHPHLQSPNNPPCALILLWITVTVFMVALVLVVGFLHIRRHKASSKTTAAASHSVCGQDTEDDPDGVTYAVVVKKNEQDKDAGDAADNVNVCFESNHTKPQSVREEDEFSSQVVYSAVTIRETPQALQRGSSSTAAETEQECLYSAVLMATDSGDA